MSSRPSRDSKRRSTRSVTITSVSAVCTHCSPWIKSGVGYVGIPEHAEQCRRTRRARRDTHHPCQSLAGLGTYYMTFGGDTERAIEQTRPRHRGRARRSVLVYWAACGPAQRPHLHRPARARAPTRRSVSPTKSATTSNRPGATCSVQHGSRRMAIAVRPVDPDRIADAVRRISRPRDPGKPPRSGAPSPSSFAGSCSSPAVATPTLRPRCGEPSSATTTWATDEACSTCSPASPASPTVPDDRRPLPSCTRDCKRPATSTDFPAPRTSATPRGESQNTSHRRPGHAGGAPRPAARHRSHHRPRARHPRRHRRRRTRVASVSAARGCLLALAVAVDPRLEGSDGVAQRR